MARDDDLDDLTGYLSMVSASFGGDGTAYYQLKAEPKHHLFLKGCTTHADVPPFESRSSLNWRTQLWGLLPLGAGF